jgi:hypothetical protein
MAQPLTYYSGVLAGRQFQAEQQAQQEDLRLKKLQRESLLRKMAEEDQTKALLSRAYSSAIPLNTADNAAQSNLSVANESISAGRALMGINPEVGINLIKQGQIAQQQATMDEIRNSQLKAARAEEAGLIMGGISDQQTLDEAQESLAKLGVIIPERYKTYSPETQEWLKNRAIASERFLRSQQIQNETKRVLLDEQYKQSLAEDRIKKQKLAEAKEARLQNKVSAGAKIKTIPQKEIMAEVAGLNEIEEFSDLSSGHKLQAARDVYSLANQYLAEGTAENQAVAMARARQEVINRIDQETGEYLGFGGGGSVGVPSQEEWLAKAKEANPTATEEALINYYNSKYAK